ncbi:Lrp/AsnC family transcriptional regulator [Emcibacter nanhaiensis]|uniref:Lrp/AsnC family transcriptional regulator n=1 Tax=Emcibacter nanhaiensis TaxID=1505037 RepID=A0A501PKW8_9PROT|nr:Lrp/AsnC family transcriptional regulator [Emcibacter nanhaiensis]TPD60707.1 Lrp/AsnC family transcriptional regulator [Emcibacter nanhaiensis]
MSKKLDDLDQQILEYLSRDATISNRKLATTLGVTEGTVRGRIKRLQEDKMIRITAVTDIARYEKTVLAYIGVHTEHTRVVEVARLLAAQPEIRFVASMLGRFNILAMTRIEEPEQLVDLVNNSIATIPGVKHVETSLGLKFIKYDYRWGRILDND